MSQEWKLSYMKVLVIIGFTFTSFALTLGVTTYAVPYWMFYNSTNSTATSDWYQNFRTRGIFQECLNQQNNVPSISTPFVIKGGCIDIDYGQYSTNTTTWKIINIRQSQIGLHAAALLFLFITLFVGMGLFIKWCCNFVDSTFYIKWRIVLGFLSLLSFLSLSASSGLGTALIILERGTEDKIQNANWNYGYMFYLAWTASFISLVSCILFFVSSHMGKSLESNKYKPKVVAIDNPAFYEDSKFGEPIFLQPSTGSNFGLTPMTLVANDSSPGKLPRYGISSND